MDSRRMLEFGGKKIVPDIRKLSDMKDVIYDGKWLKDTSDNNLYFMYRNLSTSKQDQSIIKDHVLRYDITIIPPYNLGLEFVKTAGHYHPLIDGTENTYPEVYEVLEGVAHYLLQKFEKNRITDVVLIEAEKGDKVIIPPNYGHVTINPSNEELKMANWVSDDFMSIYEPYKKYGGAAYFELVDGLIPNTQHDYVPDIRYIKPINVPEIGFYKGKNMYNLVQDIENLSFLNEPHDYGWLWESVLKKEE